jgi:hypothetical protein
VGFCLAGLEWALKTAQPKIFNTDQRPQFTSEQFTGLLLAYDVESRDYGVPAPSAGSRSRIVPVVSANEYTVSSCPDCAAL